jgi:hypothetical protein
MYDILVISFNYAICAMHLFSNMLYASDAPWEAIKQHDWTFPNNVIYIL